MLLVCYWLVPGLFRLLLACYWPVPGLFRLLLTCSLLVPLVTGLFRLFCVLVTSVLLQINDFPCFFRDTFIDEDKKPVNPFGSMFDLWGYDYNGYMQVSEICKVIISNLNHALHQQHLKLSL